jgi:type IV secretion system protein VirB4
MNHLKLCLTGEDNPVNIHKGCYFLDELLSDQDMSNGTWPRLGGRYLKVVTISAFPEGTTPNLLSALDNLPFPYRLTSRFVFVDEHRALASIDAARKAWHNKIYSIFAYMFGSPETSGARQDRDAVRMVDEAEEAEADVKSGRAAWGHYTGSIVLMDENPTKLDNKCKLVAKIIARLGLGARIEELHTVESWLGSLPGHVTPCLRKTLVSSDNLADLAPLSSVWAGNPEAPCDKLGYVGGPALATVVTEGSTPMSLNLHVGDVGHSLIIGPTGAGKTVLLCTVAAQALRYAGMRIWAFDYKHGLMALTLGCGGQHYDVGGAASPSFAPLDRLDTEIDRAAACAWIADCFELQVGHRPTVGQTAAIQLTIDSLSADPTPGCRSLTHFRGLVQDIEIKAAIKPYTHEGSYGYLLDATEDSIDDARFLTVEMEELYSLPNEIVLPVMLYLFRKFERTIDGNPTLLILDEAWSVLQHPVFRAKLYAWLKVLRSKNVAVVIATQSLAEAVKSEIFAELMDACKTRIYLPNDQAMVTGTDAQPGPYNLYRACGLNDTQITLLRDAIPKRDYYIVTPEGRRMFSLGLGPTMLAFCAPSVDDVREIKRMVSRYGDNWWREWIVDCGAL